MRLALVTFAAFTASFAVVGAQSPQTDMTRLPLFVNVMNWPETQAVVGSVSVDNLPAMQTVGGTVNLGNLPTVQPVSGTVTVGNLPLTEDGSIRVSAGLAQSPQHVVMCELMPYYTPFSNFVALPPGIETIGYRAVADSVTVPPGGNIAVQLYWQMTPDDDFRETHGAMPGSEGMNDCGRYGDMFSNGRYICANYGGRPGIVLHQGNSDAATSVRLYLIP
jgi:hypothetical protein